MTVHSLLRESLLDGREHAAMLDGSALGIQVLADQGYVYTAATQGSVAAANALFHSEREVDYTALPRVTFTSPAIASAGLTEAELVRSGVACDCRVLPLKAVPRAIVNRDTRGVVKLVVEAATGRIRGVHAVADGAGR